MDVDQQFTILEPGKNAAPKKYKLVKNILTDQNGQNIDFNGTYKDMRGVFAVVHGVVDQNPSESTFDIQESDSSLLGQLNLYKKELKRIEAENKALQEALNNTRV